MTHEFTPSRWIASGIAAAILIATAVSGTPASADQRPIVCSAARQGQISAALRLPAARQYTIVISGTCTDNGVIARDDVTLRGTAGASITPADPTRPTIFMDAVRRDTSFGLDSVNTIRSNGATGEPGTLGGIYAFQGATIDVTNAAITANTSGGAVAFEEGVLDFREGNTISGSLARGSAAVDAFDGGSGVVVGFNSTGRLRPGTAVSGNAAHGVMLYSGGGDFRHPPAGAPASVSGNTGYGLKCFFAYYSGNVTLVSGNTGGGNVDASGNIPGCTRF